MSAHRGNVMNETCSNDCRLSAKAVRPVRPAFEPVTMLASHVNEDEVVPPTACGPRSPRSDAAAHQSVVMTKHTDDVAWTQPLASEDVQGVALGSCGRGAQNSLSAKGSMGAKGALFASGRSSAGRTVRQSRCCTSALTRRQPCAELRDGRVREALHCGAAGRVEPLSVDRARLVRCALAFGRGLLRS